MNIEDISKAIRNNRIRITDHADEEAEAEALSFEEIYFPAASLYTAFGLITKILNGQYL